MTKNTANDDSSSAQSITPPVNIAGDLTVTGNTSLVATTLSGALTVNSVSNTQSVLPVTDDLYNIGSSSLKYSNVFSKNLVLKNASFTTSISTGATGNYTLVLPVDDGTPNQILKTDGSGVLSWTNDSVGSTTFQALTDVTVQSGGSNYLKLSSTAANLIMGYIVAPSLSSGTQNTVYGISAGNALTSGGGNTLIGYGAGKFIDIGTQNILIGSQIGLVINGGTNNILIGNNEVDSATATNRISIGCSGSIINTLDNSMILGGNALTVIHSDGNNVCDLGQVLKRFKSVFSTNHIFNNGSFSTTLASGATSNHTITLPINGGSSTNSLTTNGSGVTSWTALSLSYLSDVVLTNTSGTIIRISGSTGLSNTLVGNECASNSVAFSGATMVGNKCGVNISNSGSNYNSGLGYRALEGLVNNASSKNTAIGLLAGASLTNGNGNTYLGNSADSSATCGYGIALGHEAITASNTFTFGGATAAQGITLMVCGGATNTCDIGSSSKKFKDIYSTTHLLNNGSFTTTIAAGASANWTLTLPTTAGTSGYFMTTNGSGTAAWTNNVLSSLSNVTTNNNTGVLAVFDLTNADFYIGQNAGGSRTIGTASANCCVGNDAGKVLTTATNCVFLGTRAGYTAQTSSQCTYIGRSADSSTSAGTNRNAFGYNSTSDTDNSIQLGNTSVTVIKTSNGATDLGSTAQPYNNVICNYPIVNGAKPANSSSTGVLGQWTWGIDTLVPYLYICTATNTWFRAALTTF